MPTILLNPACGACDCSGVRIGRAYVGGDFTTIGGASKTRLAKLDGSGVTVAAFTASADDWVEALYLDEARSHLWAGGFFLTINGTSSKALVCVNMDTGAIVYSYNIVGNISGTTGLSDVFAMDSDGTYLYFGGDFRTIDAVTGYRHIARVSLTTGVVDTSWKPVLLGGGVTDLDVRSSTIYVASSATLVNAVVTQGAFALSTGSPTGSPTWNAVWTSGGALSVLAQSSSSIFLGGTMSLGSGATFQARLIEFNGSGAATSWNPTPGVAVLQGGASPSGDTLAPFQTTSFLVGGDFTSAAGVSTDMGNLASFLYAGAHDEAFTHSTPAGSTATFCEDIEYASDGRVYAVYSGTGKGAYAYSGTDGSTFTSWAPACNGNCYSITTSATP